MSTHPEHDYHLVNPSPWPILGATSIFLLALGAVLYFHDQGSVVMIIGLLGIIGTMIVWWRDVIDEAQNKGDHTPVVQLHMRYGMVLFIMSEVMFFVAWFWAYFDAGFLANDPIQYERQAFTGGEWPPKGITTLDPWGLPLMNTLILLLSGTTVTSAHQALIEGDREGLKKWLWWTVILGAIFMFVQIYEYGHTSFDIANNIYGTTFFMATGFHGFHVFVGTIFLAVCLWRARKGHFSQRHHFGFEAAAWYWHFVDVVWLFLFVFIYIWGASPSPS